MRHNKMARVLSAAVCDGETAELIRVRGASVEKDSAGGYRVRSRIHSGHFDQQRLRSSVSMWKTGSNTRSGSAKSFLASFRRWLSRSARSNESSFVEAF